ncbi:hypothetical protein XAC3810_140016 [Xanthomonas citri pv. citri]|uniref:Uncharacterized protein n=1 Tax=Xanthomonas citri pv. citri TaxID=611301 RepID=A0A0U5F8M8_XANCI|nr:hypothetical protein XAC3824_130207 [Xanthomonas citri pv. citri]CEE18041.1 hypothetical protein XAC9322_140140 [Xanthomonas citri pv. citri]CEE18990.1 hypothetical protein XAC1083_140208 [Xanthomonas citri pv. citri]CEE26034.1 hypothetical protein XAC2911_120206 [Xanthomonas citri pv. citri]CEE26110.1 hypothetical protein XAC902_160041 [Xanthomonas citri pv. citri]
MLPSSLARRARPCMAANAVIAGTWLEATVVDRYRLSRPGALLQGNGKLEIAAPFCTAAIA